MLLSELMKMATALLAACLLGLGVGLFAHQALTDDPGPTQTEYLEGGVAIAEAKVGKGMLVLFGPEILFRAQPHGTFKFLFNGLVQAGRRE